MLDLLRTKKIVFVRLDPLRKNMTRCYTIIGVFLTKVSVFCISGSYIGKLVCQDDGKFDFLFRPW